MSESDRRGRALFPASFDPVTNGHLDLVHRARLVFPELVVAVAHNVAKSGMFSVEERMEMLRDSLADSSGIQITAFEGLLVDYAREIGARVVIRGLRAMADFEYEFEMALMNKHLYPDIETLFMMTSQPYLWTPTALSPIFGCTVITLTPALRARTHQPAWTTAA